MGDLPHIDKALKIEIEKDGEKYRADAKILPGTPAVGVGKTEAEAKYDLLAKLLYNIATDPDGTYSLVTLSALKENYRSA